MNMKTMKKTILGLMSVWVGLTMMVSCQKGEACPMLTGKWENTSETYSDNIAGGHFVDAGSFTIEFKGRKANLGGEGWNNYWVEEESGIRYLAIENLLYCRMPELTADRLVLVNDAYDAGFRWVMRRTD